LVDAALRPRVARAEGRNDASGGGCSGAEQNGAAI
jgi:hypothetical protein